MARIYDSIPRAGGRHRVPIEGWHSGLNVRAERPPIRADGTSEEQARPTYQLVFNESKRMYRVRPWQDAAPQGDADFTEVAAIDSDSALVDAVSNLPAPAPYVVFENSATGEVFYDGEYSIGRNWTQDGRFDQITMFDNEEEAAAYVAERQESHQRNA